MEERNITAKFLGLHEYFKDFSTEEIDERRLVDDIKEINPSIVVMVICYSQILCLRFLLEVQASFRSPNESGSLLAIQRTNLDNE